MLRNIRVALVSPATWIATGGLFLALYYAHHYTKSAPISMTTLRAPVISVTHGGGPMPLLGAPTQKQLAHSMRTRVPQILRTAEGSDASKRPSAIVLVTAHWETKKVQISSNKQHSLLFDYYGFPPESYKYTYDAPGSPELAQKVQELLKKKHIPSELDDKRGWDHGVFVPMLLIHPKADIPVVQVSVLASQDPAELYALGEALAPLRDANIAIIGSGSASFHNIRLMISGSQGDVMSEQRQRHWNQQVDNAVMQPDSAKRRAALLQWRNWDFAYEAHPRNGSEHFSPLVVCAGAAGDEAGKAWSDPFAEWEMRTYYWD